MAESPAYFEPGSKLTMTASAGVTGGQLVALTGGRRIGPAGAASTAVVGVAERDALAEEQTAVGTAGVYRLTAAGAIAAGDRVVAGAAGTVAAAGATPDARTVVGIALEAIADTSSGLILLTVG